MGLVREALAAEAVLPNTSVPFGEAMNVVKRTRPDVVVVGYSRAIEAAIALAEALKRDGATSTLVALAERSDAEAILAAMRAGYKEFVVLPDDAARLRQAVHEAAYAPQEDEEKGVVIAVCGAKGGVGTTTVATHLACELAAIHRVLCMDLDMSMGDVAPQLDLTPRDTIADVLPRADRVDERSLAGSVVVHRSKLHVLAMPDEMENLGEVRGDDIYSVLNAASKAYQFVIVDIGTFYDECATLTLQVADTILMITTPDVTSVRDTFRRMRMLATLGIDKERVRLVINKWQKGSHVGLDDIRNNLQLEIAATVAYDPKTVDQAVNEGKLVRDINRKADVTRDMANLVAVLADDGRGTVPTEIPAPSAEGNKSKSLFAGWFGRS